LVPAAIVALALALWRPRSREESAFAALAVGVLGALFAEAALYATNGSDRFQERYLMVLLPLAFPALLVWLRRGRPGARYVAAIALGLVVVWARGPLFGYTVSGPETGDHLIVVRFRV